MSASVVVPALISSDAPSGISAGGQGADGVLRRGLHPRPDVQPGVRSGGGGQADRAAVRADEHAVGVELVEVAADGVGGDVEALGEAGDRHLPLLGDVGGQLGLAPGGEAARPTVGVDVGSSSSRHSQKIAQTRRVSATLQVGRSRGRAPSASIRRRKPRCVRVNMLGLALDRAEGRCLTCTKPQRRANDRVWRHPSSIGDS